MERKITLTKTLMFALTFLLGLSTFAQQRTCATDEYMAEALKNPVFAAQHKADQKKFQAELERRANGDFSARGGATITIPVAVHFPSGNEADRACLVALAQSQVDVINADYTASNTDINQWAAASVFYPGLQPGAANIQFCLATSNHPVGVDPELLEGEPAVTIGYNFANGSGFPELDSNFQGYMNFLVKDIGAGLLGYSPGGGSIANGGAVVMNLGTLGTGGGCAGSGIVPQAPFNLGRTVTHELGHFYTLNHPWGPGGPSCAADDGFADTPNTGQETYNCPGNGSETSCGNTVLTMNYMDYVNDACMYMFTPQQMNAVDAYITSVIAPAIKPGVCEPAVPGFNMVAGTNEIETCPDTDTQAVYNFTYSTVMDFNETTTFSASGQPAGTTVTFNPTSLNNDGAFTMTVNNISGSTPGNYTITVTGTSNTVTETVDVVLNNVCVECTTSTATDTPITIDAAGAPGSAYTSIITITEDSPITDVNVTMTINHDWIRDITATITSPNGTVVELTSVNGVDGAGSYSNTTFDQEATTPIAGQVSPFAGTFMPEGDLSLIYGEMSAGDWTLTVIDNFAADGGFLTDFQLELCLQAPLSVDEFGFENFAIFPNPNNGEFTIKLNSLSDNDINVDVFDIRGRKVFSNSYLNNSDFSEVVKLNNVQTGLYLVTINDGNRSITKKIVVE